MTPKEEMAAALAEINGSITNISTKQASTIAKMQAQIDAIDIASQARGFITNQPASPAFVETLKNDDAVQRLVHDRRGRAIITLKDADALALLSRKTTITAGGVGGQGFAVGGVLPSDRDAGITVEARQQLTIRNVLSSRPTAMGVVDFVRVSTPMGNASPVAETVVKPENKVTFVNSQERIKTIATWIPASKQVLDDMSELSGFIETSLGYYVNREEELQIISGDNVGEDLHGLIMQSTPFSTGLLVGVSGWTKIDLVGLAIEQLTTANEIPPTFVIMHPSDWWSIRLTKDTLGRYLIGNPQTTANANLFDLTVIPTTSIVAGTFLVGSGNPAACELRDRMELQVEISTEHADYFTRNLIAIRAEKRMCVVVKRPASFISGSFSSSPA